MATNPGASAATIAGAKRYPQQTDDPDEYQDKGKGNPYKPFSRFRAVLGPIFGENRDEG